MLHAFIKRSPYNASNWSNVTMALTTQGNFRVPLKKGNPEVLTALQPWKEVIDAEGNVVIGQTKVDLLQSPCSSRECNLGNFFCDAMIHAFAGLMPYSQEAWTNVSIGLINTGALRVPLFRGNLTYAHMVSMSPFENILTAFNLPGDKLVEALEFSVSEIDLPNGVNSSSIFLQFAGLKVTYNFTNPVGKRVADIKVRCAACAVPKYENFDEKKLYRIVAPNFIVGGGGGFSMFRDFGTDLQGEMTDLDALVVYTKDINPIYTGIEERITVLI